MLISKVLSGDGSNQKLKKSSLSCFPATLNMKA